MWALIAISAFASFMKGRAQATQYAGQAAIANYRARLAEADAKAQARATDFAQTQQAIQSERIMGAIRAEQGARGARTDVGAPFKVRSQQIAELEADRALIGMSGRAKESAFRSEAIMQDVQKRLFRKGKRTAFISGFLGAGSSALGGFTRAKAADF
jgi:hypothetical protein